jgi:hypothetical protein
LKGVLEASNLPTDAKRDLNRVEDHLQKVTEGGIVASLATFFGLENVTDDPKWTLPAAADEKTKWLTAKLDQYLDMFFDLTLRKEPPTPHGMHFQITRKRRTVSKR